MTEQSYQEHYKNGVVEELAPVCLLAALDRISFYHEVPEDLYFRYEWLYVEFLNLLLESPDIDRSKEAIHSDFYSLMKEAYAALGVHTSKNIVKCNITPPMLRSQLAKLTVGGFRIVVTLQDDYTPHAVGLIPNKDGTTYRARSTHTPFEDEDRVAVEEIEDLLHQPERFRLKESQGSRKTKKDSNIMALPPEAKR